MTQDSVLKHLHISLKFSKLHYLQHLLPSEGNICKFTVYLKAFWYFKISYPYSQVVLCYKASYGMPYETLKIMRPFKQTVPLELFLHLPVTFQCPLSHVIEQNSTSIKSGCNTKHCSATSEWELKFFNSLLLCIVLHTRTTPPPTVL